MLFDLILRFYFAIDSMPWNKIKTYHSINYKSQTTKTNSDVIINVKIIFSAESLLFLKLHKRLNVLYKYMLTSAYLWVSGTVNFHTTISDTIDYSCSYTYYTIILYSFYRIIATRSISIRESCVRFYGLNREIQETSHTLIAWLQVLLYCNN